MFKLNSWRCQRLVSLGNPSLAIYQASSSSLFSLTLPLFHVGTKYLSDVGNGGQVTTIRPDEQGDSQFDSG
jgi:hypothetical protein